MTRKARVIRFDSLTERVLSVSWVRRQRNKKEVALPSLELLPDRQCGVIEQRLMSA